MAKTTVHIIPHTHWDKEWYFTSSRSKVYLMRQIQEIIDVLANKPDYHSFLLDGQTSLIDDYLRYYPEDRAVVQALIRGRRLLIGPWYTQTDQSVVSAESIVRNLYYGIKGAQTLGHSMSVAYCPDVFGQGGNMPQIYQKFNIDSFLFWRGIADDRLCQLEFTWQGSDGSSILAVQLYFAYYYGLNIPKTPGTMLDYIESVIEPLEERASIDTLYFPSGGDQSPIQHDLVEVVNVMNEQDQAREYHLSTPDAYFSEVKKEVSDLPVIQGELVEGKNSRIHKSIYSTRADLKQVNNQIENKLTNVLEPLLSISHALGNQYPQKEVEEIWKLMFENAAHDSIGGCNSDETNQDIGARYKLAKDMVTNLLDLHMREISMKINQEEKVALTIFNTLPYKRSEVLEAELYIPDGHFKLVNGEGKEVCYTILHQEDQSDYLLNQFAYLTPHLYQQEMSDQYIPNKVFFARLLIEVPNVPAMGYLQLFLLPDEAPDKQSVTESMVNQQIENEYYRVTYNDVMKSFTVVNKLNNKVYSEQFVLVDNGDDGDSYNYSPPVDDWVIKSNEQGENFRVRVTSNDLEQKIDLAYELRLPSDLVNRSQRLKDSKLEIKQTISLRKNEKMIRATVDLDNQIKDHRMCLMVDTEIKATHSIADKLFGVEASELRHRKMDNWETEGWSEAPISINPMQSFVSLTDQQTTVAVMTEGVREYEIIGKDYSRIQLTLFRCFGFMGKENLVYRPGRASGEKIVATPDAQLQKTLHFELAVSYEEATFEEVEIARKSKEYLTPLQIYELSDFLNGRTIFKKNALEVRPLDQSFSLLDFGESKVILSTVKKSEVGDNLVYRIFNPFLSQTVTVETVVDASDTAVLLDEVSRCDCPSELDHNQFLTMIKLLS